MKHAVLLYIKTCFMLIKHLCGSRTYASAFESAQHEMLSILIHYNADNRFFLLIYFF